LEIGKRQLNHHLKIVILGIINFSFLKLLFNKKENNGNKNKIKQNKSKTKLKIRQAQFTIAD
jgi:hypothetical protein